MDTKDILTISVQGLTLLVAAVTFAKGLVEFRKQGVTKRAEMFLQMRARLRQDASFCKICDLLEADSPELRQIALVERDRLSGSSRS